MKEATTHKVHIKPVSSPTAQDGKGLPKRWEVKKLGEVCQIIMGQSPPSTTYNTNGIGLPFFQGKAEFTELYPVVEKWCNSPNKIAEPNDILLSVRAPVGTTNIANIKCCIGRGLAAIRYDNYKYVFYFLKSIEQTLDSKGTGTTFRAISGETIRMTEIPVPPPAEQQAIVAKIEELLSELENGKQQLLTAQQQLKVYRQSLLKWAFEGKLTNKEVKDGELPKGWIVTNLGALKEFSLYGPRFSSDDYSEDGIAVLRTSDISENGKVDWAKAPKLNLSSEEYEKYKLIKDDILITRTGSIGTISVFNDDKKAIAGAFLIYYRLKKPVNIKYIFHFLKSHKAQSHFRNASKGVGRPNLNVPNIELLQIPLANFAEQNKIIEELESKLTVCDKIEETISQSLQQAETLRQSILKKAFEGKLVKVELKTGKKKELV